MFSNSTWIFLALVAALALAGCHATTGYNADHSQSWTCIPNTGGYPNTRRAVAQPLDEYSFLQGKSVPIAPVLVVEDQPAKK